MGAGLALSLAACGGSGGEPSGPPRVAEVSVSLPGGSTVLRVGEEIALVVAAQTAEGETVQVFPVRWSSSNENVAMVSASGVVRGLSVGTARIQAEVNGVSGRLDIVVLPGW